MDFDKIQKHFEKLGEFVEGVFNDLDVTKTSGGDPEQTGVRVTKLYSGGVPIVVIEVEVPGCTFGDVSVDVNAGILSIQWTPKMTDKPQSRTFSLSKNADVDHISAKVKDGYLTVTIPGVTEKSPSRKVNVSQV